METNDIQHTDFVVYCIETYKGIKNLDGRTAYQKLNEAGAIEYIDKNYGALHTFGDEYIVWNIDEYLKASRSTQEKNILQSLEKVNIKYGSVLKKLGE